LAILIQRRYSARIYPFQRQRSRGDTVSATLEQIYDGFAETYDKNRNRFEMTEVLDSFFARLSVEQGKLLDLGCGAGEPLPRFFIDRAWDVTGVDFSERMLALASIYAPEMKRIHADMRQVDFAPDRFDAITAIYSLFHIPSTDHASLFESFYRWLRPEGKALLTYATREYTGSDEFDGYKELMGQTLYYSHKSPENLYTDLERAGFDIEAADHRVIGNETFLWVTMSKPASASRISRPSNA